MSTPGTHHQWVIAQSASPDFVAWAVRQVRSLRLDGMNNLTPSDYAAEFVRRRCEVTDLAALDTDSEAGKRFRGLIRTPYAASERMREKARSGRPNA